MAVNRVRERFALLRGRGEKALMTYLPWVKTGSYSSAEMLRVFEEAGVDLVEFGVPTSSPWMDGPVMQRNHRTALAQGPVREAFHFLAAARAGGLALPLLAMAFGQAVLDAGDLSFFKACAESGVDGVEIPDYPIAAAPDRLGWYAAARQVGLSWVGFCDTALASAREGTPAYDLLTTLLRRASGFVFILSAPGVTGAKQGSVVSDQLVTAVANLRRVIAAERLDLSLLVGFGISGPESVREVLDRTGADAVVVGSACSRLAQEARSLREVLSFIKGLKEATR